MSRNTQDKFLAALTAIAEEDEYEVINDTQWANTGRIRIERPNGFSAVVSFKYSFQDGYSSFSDMKPVSLGMPHLLPRGEQPMVRPFELTERMLEPIKQLLAARR